MYENELICIESFTHHMRERERERERSENKISVFTRESYKFLNIYKIVIEQCYLKTENRREEFSKFNV